MFGEEVFCLLQQLEAKKNKVIVEMGVRMGGLTVCLTLSERFLSASLNPGEERSWAAWRSWSAKLVMRGWRRLMVLSTS